mmetsp:Transcript_30086/g.44415  ORF Transcript_30086/g.44415 Transcript_30086/m.44415 type:complete len:217 (+) Transcript_30086:69-719(+)
MYMKWPRVRMEVATRRVVLLLLLLRRRRIHKMLLEPRNDDNNRITTTTTITTTRRLLQRKRLNPIGRRHHPPERRMILQRQRRRQEDPPDRNNQIAATAIDQTTATVDETIKLVPVHLSFTRRNVETMDHRCQQEKILILNRTMLNLMTTETKRIRILRMIQKRTNRHQRRLQIMPRMTFLIPSLVMPWIRKRELIIVCVVSKNEVRIRKRLVLLL